ncbi:conjugal transfer protein TraF [Cardiobacterium sp. AH-315-I02]|nr:conjugal transfer protein TraF [Cardiobacterium sp. AH-315-I02]
MSSSNKRSLYLLISSLVINGVLADTLLAEPIYHPAGPKLTFGGMTHRQMTVSDMGNPAHPAIDPTPEESTGRYGVGLSIGLGIEYDGHDRLFELLNKAGSDDGLAPGDGPDDGGGESGPNFPDITDPDLIALIDEIKTKAVSLGALVGVAVSGLNAKAFTSADIPILISNDVLGGSWAFGANISLTTNLKGLSDPIEFDADAALVELEKAYQASKLPSGGTEAETFQITKGLSVTVDPITGKTTFRFENNSGTITRAAQVSEISIGYSRKVWQKESNAVYIGIKPKYYNVGLSNAFIFLDNIEDAKSIFEALDKDSFSYTEKLSMDLGAIWTGKQYQLGATLTNINEPDFKFPGVDLSNISNPNIVDAILRAQTYTMERQLKLEGGYISKSGAWGLNVGIDANAVPDPMFDDYQWVSLGAGFASDNWWLPGARVGIRKNMAGTKLTYITAGITVFNVVNLDLATTTQTIKVDGKTIPQGLVLNIGAQVLF